MSSTNEGPVVSPFKIGDNPSPAPVPGPAPTNEGVVLSPSSIVQLVQALLQFVPTRATFNPTTLSFWSWLGGIAGVVLAWVNPGGALNTAVQTAITAVGGLVVLLVSHHASSKTPVSQVAKLQAKLAGKPLPVSLPNPVGHVINVHVPMGATWEPPTPLVPSPGTGTQAPGTGGVSTGYTGSSGSVGSGNESEVAAPGGGTTGEGGTTIGENNEGNVEPGNYVEPVAPGTGTESEGGQVSEGYTGASGNVGSGNVAPGADVGSNSAEGTGGPSVTEWSGPYPQNESTEPEGSYVQPPSPTIPGGTGSAEDYT